MSRYTVIVWSNDGQRVEHSAGNDLSGAMVVAKRERTQENRTVKIGMAGKAFWKQYDEAEKVNQAAKVDIHRRLAWEAEQASSPEDRESAAREIDEILQAAHEKVGIKGVFEAIDNNTQTTLLLEAA